MMSRGLALGMLLVAPHVRAAEPPPVVLLWPAGAPGSEGKTDSEKTSNTPTLTGAVTSVHKPSLTVYLPSKETNTRAAVVVIPGGGHRLLAIEHEGYAVGRWLAERGVAAFILKYRLAREEGSTYQVETHALGDTQRAIRVVRHNAKEWGIDPARVGVLGFSAGGELAALASYKEPVLLSEADPIGKESSRPDFQALLYPAIPKDMKPARDMPPAFLACGFGDRETDKSPAGAWPARFREWLDDQGFLGRK